jgi:hypothetical protein
VYRVINFCHLLTGTDALQLQKLSIAGAFHDLGIWTGPSTTCHPRYTWPKPIWRKSAGRNGQPRCCQ